MKFVVHHHMTVPDHYDLMIERENSLATWRIDAVGMVKFLSGIEIPAERIDDHRKIYLQYEGPISCDRGNLVIFDSGTCQVDEWSDSRILARVKGKKIYGGLEIKKYEGLITIIIKRK